MWGGVGGGSKAELMLCLGYKAERSSTLETYNSPSTALGNPVADVENQNEFRSTADATPTPSPDAQQRNWRPKRERGLPQVTQNVQGRRFPEGFLTSQ